MSWRSAAARALAATLLLAALAGCGFRPLYGTRSTDPVVMQELAGIYIKPIPDRQGQLVHNALLVRLNPSGEPRDPRYRLDVTVGASESQVALQQDNTASRDEVTYNVSYLLFSGDQLVTTGSFSRQFSFDFLPQQYANISARADVARRSADEIADEIRNRMAAYFARAAQARAAASSAPQAPASQ